MYKKNVIQTTEGRKNLENIYINVTIYVPEILRFALNDNQISIK